MADTSDADEGAGPEVTAVEVAGWIVEALRVSGSFTGHYNGPDERKVYQEAGRMACRMLEPRVMTWRSAEGVFVACWKDETPLEQEMTWHRMVAAVNAIQPASRRQQPPPA